MASDRIHCRRPACVDLAFSACSFSRNSFIAPTEPNLSKKHRLFNSRLAPKFESFELPTWFWLLSASTVAQWHCCWSLNWLCYDCWCCCWRSLHTRSGSPRNYCSYPVRDHNSCTDLTWCLIFWALYVRLWLASSEKNTELSAEKKFGLMFFSLKTLEPK